MCYSGHLLCIAVMVCCDSGEDWFGYRDRLL